MPVAVAARARISPGGISTPTLVSWCCLTVRLPPVVGVTLVHPFILAPCGVVSARLALVLLCGVLKAPLAVGFPIFKIFGEASMSSSSSSSQMTMYPVFPACPWGGSDIGPPDLPVLSCKSLFLPPHDAFVGAVGLLNSLQQASPLGENSADLIPVWITRSSWMGLCALMVGIGDVFI